MIINNAYWVVKEQRGSSSFNYEMSKEHYMIYILFLCILSYKIYTKKAKWNIIELILIEWKYGHVSLLIRKSNFCVLILVNRITEEELK